ncbi:uncharacterized protein LOC143247782 isoform X2 [Tachypleus tridentatus]|uniref:uncharacterized protein LOC143247782 isoform X2 n=1 Tax=Tachypleus tridentatus TaxID=6853 RepID=UPI003FD037E4
MRHHNNNKLTMRSLKSTTFHRIPSPDSACEQDWTPTAPESIRSERKSTTYDSNSDSSDSGLMTVNSSSNKEKVLSNIKHNAEIPGHYSGFHPQDSDGDSGIVSVGWKKDRVGSVCSTERDYSQGQFQNNNNHTRATYLSAMHSNSLKDLCDGKVQFNEQLHLSEHNIRQSCRKLFQSLYAQKYGVTKFESIHSNSNSFSSSVETMDQPHSSRNKSVVVSARKHELSSGKQDLTSKMMWSTFKESSNIPVYIQQNRCSLRHHPSTPPSVSRYKNVLTRDSFPPNRSIYTGLASTTRDHQLKSSGPTMPKSYTKKNDKEKSSELTPTKLSTAYDQINNSGPRLTITNTEDNQLKILGPRLARTNAADDQINNSGPRLTRTNIENNQLKILGPRLTITNTKDNQLKILGQRLVRTNTEDNKLKISGPGLVRTNTEDNQLKISGPRLAKTNTKDNQLKILGPRLVRTNTEDNQLNNSGPRLTITNTKDNQLKILGPRLVRTNTKDNQLNILGPTLAITNATKHDEEKNSGLILGKTTQENDQEKRTELTLVRTNTKYHIGKRLLHKNTTKNLEILCTVVQNTDFDCSETSTKLNWNRQPFKTSLFKSRSCATLPSENLRTADIPFSGSLLYKSQDQLESSRSDHGQLVSPEKSPSCNTVVEKNHQDRDIRSDDKTRTYTHVVSVTPERLQIQEDVKSAAKTNMRYLLSTDSRSELSSEYTDHVQVLFQAEDSEDQTNTCVHPKNSGTSSLQKSSFTKTTKYDTLKKRLWTKKTSRLFVGVKSRNKTETESNNTPVSTESSLSNDQVKTEELPEYAVIDKSKKTRRPPFPRVVSNPCIINNSGGVICEQQQFLHSSDCPPYKSSATSGKPILERLQGFTKSAKGALQRAFSTDHVYTIEKEATVHKPGMSQSFFEGLKNRMSMRTSKRKTNNENKIQHPISLLEDVDLNKEFPPDHVWGQLIQLHVDGSQVVEMNKPHGKPLGFFVARGKVKNSRGVFVSRMRDYETQKLLTGLIDIGDEILEIDGVNVREKDIIEVNSLMAKKNKLTLTVLPYKNRQDV